MKPYRIRLEYGKTEPDSICIVQSDQPQISWALAAEPQQRQHGFSVRVFTQDSLLWDTGRVESSAQSIRYAGKDLIPGQVVTLQITVDSGPGTEQGTALQNFCYGTLAEWPARWISAREEHPDAVLSFIKDFHCQRKVAAACLFIGTLGYHKVYLNGRDVFTHPMNPACSEFEKRSYYTVLPGIEDYLVQGDNRIGVEAATGWRSPHHVCYELVNRVAGFAGETQLRAALRLQYSDGTIEWLGTDESWQYFQGPTVYSNIFIGERYEAARCTPRWSAPGTAVPAPRPVCLPQPVGGTAVPQTLAPVCTREEYPAISVQQVAPGVWGVDFGQNIAGVCRLRIPSTIAAGQVIEISHMEFLDEAGRLYLPQLRGAASVDRYTAAGDQRDPAWWQPGFTYHGFRYAEVKGYPGPLCKEDIIAVSLYTSVVSDSFFSSGNALVNAIQKNIVQTEKANIHSILTDCPQRDERQAWLNDSTVRFEETPYNFDVGRLFPKVVRDVLDAQDKAGAITCTAPFAFGARPADPVCSAFLLAGWESYMHTGNREILAEAYDGFKAWNDYLESQSEGYIVQYSYYGDWAAPAYACESEESAVSAVTPGILMSTGYFYLNSLLLARMAEATERREDIPFHTARAEHIRQAFLAKWWDGETGRVGTGSQGCQAFALWLDILPQEGRQKAADHLAQDLNARGGSITTGNLCTKYLMDVLPRYGYMEEAWKLLIRETYPSLGFMIQQEATTIWERFELKKNPTMNSHNHPMYGAIGYWLYACLAGLKPLRPGWEEFLIQPHIPDKLQSVNCGVATPYGDVILRWVRRYGGLHVYAWVPPGTAAQVELPWGETHRAESGFHHWYADDEM